MENENENVQKNFEIILKRVAETENIQNYEVFPNNDPLQGEGFLSEFFTGVVLDKDNGETIDVAIKKASDDGFTAGFGNEAIYKSEITFYSELFPKLDKLQKEKKVKYPFNQIPKYFTGSTEPHNLFVAMENIKTAGYKLFDKKKYLDSEHLELIFKTYGKLHALSFSFKQKNPGEYKNLTTNFTSFIETFIKSEFVMKFTETAYFTALKTFDPITEADILEKLKTVEDVTNVFKNTSYTGCYECFTHGDCWSNNMLFKYKESGELEDIKLVDFQLSCTSTPIHDLSYFFYSGASKIDMDKLDYYLELYFRSFTNFATELEANLEEMFTLDMLKKEWKQYGLFGILLGCQLWQVKLIDKDEIENVLNQRGLTEDKYWELWREKVAIILEGPVFRERARNICLHAVEYGII